VIVDRFCVTGEPGGGIRSLSLAKNYDLVLSMEILRHDSPPNVFYIPIDDNTVMYANTTKSSERPIDVLYTSSHCDKDRERIVEVIRQRIEKAGLRFEFNGRCNAGSNKPRYRFASGDEPALEAKMMIAVSRSQDRNTEALDEKLSKAMKYGCIAIYQGVGQRLADSVHGYPKAYLDRIQYSSDADFARAVVLTLQDSALLDSMQQKLTRYKWGGTKFCNEIHEYVLAHAPAWMNSETERQSAITLAKNDGASVSNDFFLRIVQCAFKDANNRNYTWVRKLQEADIEINHCCFG